MVGRLALKPEPAPGSLELGPGLQGCLLAAFQTLEELCSVALQGNRCYQISRWAVIFLQPRTFESGSQVLSAMQMCICLQKRIRGRAQLIWAAFNCPRAGRTCAEEAPYHFQSCEATCCIWIGQSPLWLRRSQRLRREHTTHHCQNRSCACNQTLPPQ